MDTHNKHTPASPKRMTKAELLKAHLALEREHQAKEELITSQKTDIRRLQNDVRKLEKKLKKVQQAEAAKQAQMRPDDIAISRYRFRIDFYDDKEGAPRGKIEHLLTQDKKTFRGLDLAVIGAFISEQVPKLSASDSAYAEAEAEDSPAVEHLRLEGFTVIPLGKRKPTNVLDHGVSYQVQLEWQQPEKLESCELLLFASPMGGGAAYPLAQVPLGPEMDRQHTQIVIHPEILPPGPYRLEAEVHYPLPETDARASAALEGSSLVQVY